MNFDLRNVRNWKRCEEAQHFMVTRNLNFETTLKSEIGKDGVEAQQFSWFPILDFSYH